jgi:hypothetical protein
VTASKHCLTYLAMMHAVTRGMPDYFLHAVLAGCNCGTLCAFYFSPRIMTTMGWPWCFYTFGSAGFVWLAVWCMCATEPEPLRSGRLLDGGRAGQSELNLTPNPLEEVATQSDCAEAASAPVAAAPTEAAAPPLGQRGAGGVGPGAASSGSVLSQIRGQLSSQRVLGGRMCAERSIRGIAWAHWVSNVGNYIGLAWFPTYFHAVWGVSRAELGVTMVPYLAVLPATLLTGWLADHMAAKHAASGGALALLASLLEPHGSTDTNGSTNPPCSGGVHGAGVVAQSRARCWPRGGPCRGWALGWGRWLGSASHCPHQHLGHWRGSREPPSLPRLPSPLSVQLRAACSDDHRRHPAAGL